MTVSSTTHHLLGQNILVTGASEGIGHAIAARLVEAGANVTLAARRAEVLAEATAHLRAKADAGQRILSVTADMSSPNSVGDLFERVGCERVYAGVDPTNEKSLRVVAKAPGVRKVDDELYELTAAAFASEC